jgi:hypothetical protein
VNPIVRGRDTRGRRGLACRRQNSRAMACWMKAKGIVWIMR